MLDEIVFFGSAIFLLFGFVVMFGAPYLPTLNKEVETALDLLDLKPGQVLLELGSGDGKVMLAAAKRGIHSVGYEINPILVVWSKLRCWRHRRIVAIHMQNYWTAEWPKYDGVYGFILQKFMGKLDTKIVQSKHDGKTIKVVLFAFQFVDRKPKKKIRGLSLYEFK